MLVFSCARRCFPRHVLYLAIAAADDNQEIYGCYFD